MCEVWRAVVGYEGLYEVSSEGRVRSLDRIAIDRNGKRTRRLKGKMLRFNLGKHGHSKEYLRFTVSLLRNAERWQAPVHRLVAEAFLPNPDDLPVVRHLDGDSTNNALSNLAWGTHQDNSDDAVEIGATPRGTQHWRSKLNAEQARIIKRTSPSQAAAKDLAARFDVHYTTIRSIWQGKSWAWV